MNFLRDASFKESGVQSVLAKNVAEIVKNYYSKLSVEKIVRKIVQKKQDKLFREGKYNRSPSSKNSNDEDSDESLTQRNSDTVYSNALSTPGKVSSK